MKRAYLLLIMILFSLCAPDLIQAHGQGKLYPFDSTEAFRSMLRSSKKADYANALKSLSLLDGVASAIKNKFEIDLVSEINSAAKSKNRERFVSAVNKFIFYDLKYIFSIIIHEGDELSSGQVQSLLQIAFLDSILLSESINSKDSLFDQHIKKLFRKAISNTKPNSRFARNASEKIDMERIAEILAEIEKEHLKHFPHFRPR